VGLCDGRRVEVAATPRPTLRSAITSMTMVPNPRRFGADSGGPSLSIQLSVRDNSQRPYLIDQVCDCAGCSLHCAAAL
jgi:hypothetical protein